MMKPMKTFGSKTVAAALAAVALAGVASAVNAQNPITRTIDPYNSVGNPYVRSFTRDLTTTVIGEVRAGADFMGGWLTVSMGASPDVYQWTFYNDCVLNSTPTLFDTQTGDKVLPQQNCSGWGIGNVNVGTNIDVRN